MTFNGQDPKNWELGPNQPIPSVDSYTYLGITINKDMNIDEQLTEMTKSANKRTGAIKKWASEKTPLTPHLGVNYIYKMIARPGTEYGAQIFSPSHQKIIELEEWQNSQLQKALKIKATPAALRTISGTRPIAARRAQLKLTFFNKLRANTGIIGKIWRFRWLKTRLAEDNNAPATKGLAPELKTLLQEYDLQDEWDIQAAEHHNSWKSKIKNATLTKPWEQDVQHLKDAQIPAATILETLGGYTNLAILGKHNFRKLKGRTKLLEKLLGSEPPTTHRCSLCNFHNSTTAFWSQRIWSCPENPNTDRMRKSFWNKKLNILEETPESEKTAKSLLTKIKNRDISIHGFGHEEILMSLISNCLLSPSPVFWRARIASALTTVLTRRRPPDDRG